MSLTFYSSIRIIVDILERSLCLIAAIQNVLLDYRRKHILAQLMVGSTRQSLRKRFFTTLLHRGDWTEKQQGYYFCDDPNCDVVYFGEDNSVITKSQLRTAVGIKECKPEALACYCFGVSNSDAQSHSNIRDFIVQKTKEGICSCDTNNPDGRCCLQHFPVKDNSNH